MNDILTFIGTQLSPGLAKLAGLVAVLFFTINGIGQVFAIWRSFRTRKALLEEEKMFNEILKLRYEIEALRKQHGLPDLLRPNAVTGQAGAAPTSVSTNAEASSVFRFHVSLPALPSLSFAPIFLAMRPHLARPAAASKRVIWALKWLAVILVSFILLFTAGMTLGSGSARDGVIGLALIGSLVLSIYFAANLIVSGVLLAIDVIKGSLVSARVSDGGDR